MSVSILIPLYNGIEFLKESIESVKRQTYPYWEIIIGINGHPKNSNIYIQAKKYEHIQIKVIEYLDTRGKPQTLNKMINDCSYNLICLLDVDDKWLPKKLEEQIKVKKDYDVVGTLCQYFGSRQNIHNILFDIIISDLSKKYNIPQKELVKCIPFKNKKFKKNAYTIFSSSHRKKIKQLHPEKNFGEISKMVGSKWKQLSDEEKQVYKIQAEQENKILD